MNREELSEVVTGKIILGEIIPTAVNPNDLVSPYREVVKCIQKDKTTDVNHLMQSTNYWAVDRAVNAANNTNGLPADWPSLLREVAIRDDVGLYLDKTSKKLRDGEAVDVGQLISHAYKLNGTERLINTATELDPESDPWVPSFWQPLDTNVGGYPKAGLTVIGAPPGTGKTSLLLKLATCAAKAEKNVMLFSMEMTGGQLVYRMEQMKKLAKKYKKNILVCDELLSPTDVAAVAQMVPDDLHFIGVDFAELMLVGDIDRSEGMMANVYQTLVRTAKQLNVPVVLLSQLNRNYEGGLPQINHLRYTGMAEALASLILLIYNKEAIFVKQDSGGALMHTPGKAWVIVGKSRYGNILNIGGRFAIQVAWEGKKGWGDYGTHHAL